MPFRDYVRYMEACREEAPLYLFDKWFGRPSKGERGEGIGREGEGMGDLTKDYTVPEYFAADLFSVLGEKRPDYKWLIIGPERSGSSFHVDPNSSGY